MAFADCAFPSVIKLIDEELPPEFREHLTDAAAEWLKRNSCSAIELPDWATEMSEAVTVAVALELLQALFTDLIVHAAKGGVAYN